jgi:hypothetical protein
MPIHILEGYDDLSLFPTRQRSLSRRQLPQYGTGRPTREGEAAFYLLLTRFMVWQLPLAGGPLVPPLAAKQSSSPPERSAARR